jgi:adenosylmethionine-8-amino-7-oxononanoate aminotransferase
MAASGIFYTLFEECLLMWCIPAPIKARQESYDALRAQIKHNCAGFIFEPLFKGAAEW